MGSERATNDRSFGPKERGLQHFCASFLAQPFLRYLRDLPSNQGEKHTRDLHNFPYIMAGNSTDDLFAFVKAAPTPTPKPPTKKQATDTPRSHATTTNAGLLSDIKRQVDEIRQSDELEATKTMQSQNTVFKDSATSQVLLAKRIDYVCEQQIYYTKKIENERRRLQDTNRRILRAKTAILQRRKQIR